jgi:hypothetical protein
MPAPAIHRLPEAQDIGDVPAAFADATLPACHLDSLPT